MNQEETRAISFAMLLAAVGAVIGIGKLLQSDEPITLRLAVGRAIVTAGLAVSAFALLAFLPNASDMVIAGFAVLLASMGESAIERYIRDRLKK